MCVDCNPLETNTGLVYYSGPNLVICNGNTITNGEILTSVIAKFDNCIGILQSQLDMSSLVENSPCINLVKTSLLTVLQSILDTESAFCTQLQTLNTQLTALQNQVNNSPVNKTINVTACNGVTVNETSTSKTFQLGAFVPKKTILPYFGDIGDFFTSGLGKPSAGLSGWAIADGRNGTINACGRYLKYDCAGCCTTGGSNNVTLGANNIPTLSFDVDAEFSLNFTGETELAGKHRHKLLADDADGGEPNCVNCSDGIPGGDPIGCGGSIDVVNTGSDPCWGDGSMGISGEHSHTFTVDSTATGTFTGNFLNPNPSNIPTPVNIEPSYIAGIPIQFLGC
jgi:hypothetical protein